MRLSPLRRAAVLTLTAGALAATSACFGSFNVTRKVYQFNKTFSSNKFVRELVFLGLNVIPVYSIASFADAIVVNSIEFWTGKNPVQVSSIIRLDSTTRVQKTVVEANGVRTMTLKAYKFDKYVATVTVQYVEGESQMTFKTVLADGRTETHVTALGTDGKAFVSYGPSTPARYGVNAGALPAK